jgi:hypothetical protein
MSNYRLTAQQRDMHDRAECSDLCPACAQIEANEPRERVARDLMITTDYEDR